MKLPTNVVNNNEANGYISKLTINAIRLWVKGVLTTDKLMEAANFYVKCEELNWDITKLRELELPVSNSDITIENGRCSVCQCKPCNPLNYRHTSRRHELNPKLNCVICKTVPCKLASTRT